MGEGKTAADVILEMIESADAPAADAADLAAEASEVAVSMATTTWEVAEARIAAVSRSLGWYLFGLDVGEEAACSPDTITDDTLEAPAFTLLDTADTTWDTEVGSGVGTGTRTGDMGERVTPVGIDAAAGITMEVT